MEELMKSWSKQVITRGSLKRVRDFQSLDEPSELEGSPI